MPILTAQERLGTTLDGKYRLDRIIGEGGMGVVYEAMQVRLERPVAVKFLHPQYSQGGEIVQRFVREARATSRLSHPNVVQVFDVDVAPEDGSVYMVLELLSGDSLATYLERKRALDPAEVLAIVGPVCDALQCAHDAGIVHRDMKPDNVFLSRGPGGRIVPKVLDFGIAKLADASAGRVTSTGAIMGTPLYMAPEQAIGMVKDIGPWTDVWSTAVMTYECLAGLPPFDLAPDSPPTAVLMAVVHAPIVPLTRRRPEIPAPLWEALAKGLQRDASARPRTASAFFEELSLGAERAMLAPERASLPVALLDSSRDGARVSSEAARTHTGPLGSSASASGASSPSATPAPSRTSGVEVPMRSRAPLLVGLGVVAVLGIVAMAAFAVLGGAGTRGPSEPAHAVSEETPPPPAPAAAPPSDTGIQRAMPPAPELAPAVVQAPEAPPDPAPQVTEAPQPAPQATEPPQPAPEVTATGARAGRREARHGGVAIPVPTPTPLGGSAGQPAPTGRSGGGSRPHRAGGVSVDDF